MSKSLPEKLTDGINALSKFGEVIQNFFKAKTTIRQADADAYADNKKLQTIRNNPDMEIVYANGEMNARLRSPEELLERSKQRRIAEEIREEKNIENILENAAEELNDASATDEPLDEDWLTRFFGITKDINSEEMQILWGRILANEIKQPSSFSLRTLEVVRNITKDEARLFEQLGKFITVCDGDAFLLNDESLLKQNNITYSDILRLNDAGLINMTTVTMAPPFPANVKIHMMITSGAYAIKIGGTSRRQSPICISLYKLTKAGCELNQILTVERSKDFMVSFAKKLYTESMKELEIGVYEIKSHVDGIITPNLPALVEFKAIEK